MKGFTIGVNDEICLLNITPAAKINRYGMGQDQRQREEVAVNQAEMERSEKIQGISGKVLGG